MKLQYVLGDLEIDEDSFELRRSGHSLPIEPRVLEFILYLIRHRPRLITKDELLEAVWQRSFVVESAITRCACLARKALGNPSLIRTVRGRGYSWTGPGVLITDRNATIAPPNDRITLGLP
jgi:DNA-binding winged helix-turn-helix (wHTH) protein